jgi:hypothetical protein
LSDDIAAHNLIVTNPVVVDAPVLPAAPSSPQRVVVTEVGVVLDSAADESDDTRIVVSGTETPPLVVAPHVITPIKPENDPLTTVSTQHFFSSSDQ